MKLLGSSEKKVTKDKNSENVTSLRDYWSRVSQL